MEGKLFFQDIILAKRGKKAWGVWFLQLFPFLPHEIRSLQLTGPQPNPKWFGTLWGCTNLFGEGNFCLFFVFTDYRKSFLVEKIWAFANFTSRWLLSLTYYLESNLLSTCPTLDEQKCNEYIKLYSRIQTQGVETSVLEDIIGSIMAVFFFETGVQLHFLTFSGETAGRRQYMQRY